MRRLEWTESAIKDLEEIADFIGRDDPVAAAKCVLKLQRAARQSIRLPLLGRQVPEVGRADVREFLIGNYRVVYRVLARSCQVVRVWERHRRMRLPAR